VRHSFGLAALLAACASPAPPPAAAPVAPPVAPAEAAADSLTGRLEAIRAQAELPALGAALVTRDGLQGVWVTGTRRAGGEERASADDLWHLGSCTKAMTATLVALLVARGDLGWETPLAALLPALGEDLHPDFRDVTLSELLGHRAGVTNTPDLSSLAGDEAVERLPPAEQRALVARIVLADASHPPRGELLYSNFGYVLAGHVAEVATGENWETLITTLLFEPLGMSSAGFGAPGTAATCDQPRGHTPDGRSVEPGPAADNPPVLGPAGTVHASLADWAKFVALHLRGAQGDVAVGKITLAKDDFARLHRPLEGPGMRYALGWVVEQRPWAGGDGRALWHNGSNTLWYCVTWLGPGAGVAALVTTNQASEAARGALDQVAGLVLQEPAGGAGAR